LAPYSVQNGLPFLDRVKEYQTAAVTEVLSHEIKTCSKHTNREVLPSEHQANKRPSQYFVRLISKQTEQSVPTICHFLQHFHRVFGRLGEWIMLTGQRNGQEMARNSFQIK
jgi:hypothetical protein